MKMSPEQIQATAEVREAEEALARAKIRLMTVGGPTHVNGVRDPANPCEAFQLGTPDRRGSCDTDGHYVCDECTRRATCEGCGLRPTQCRCLYVNGHFVPSHWT